MNPAFLYWMRRRSVPKKSVADASSNSFSLPSTHSTGGQKVYPMTVSCLVLERISQVAWTSDKLSKELSAGLFVERSTCSSKARRRFRGHTQRGMSRSPPSAFWSASGLHQISFLAQFHSLKEPPEISELAFTCERSDIWLVCRCCPAGEHVRADGQPCE